MDLFQVWIGSTRGRHTEIIGRRPDESLNQEKAEGIARERVLKAKAENKPLFAIVFDGIEGIFVSVFVTPDTKEQFKDVNAHKIQVV